MRKPGEPLVDEISKQDEASNDSEIDVIDEITVFSGGLDALVRYFRENINYPAEAVCLVENMPKWKPRRKKEKAVNCSFTIPISFKL